MSKKIFILFVLLIAVFSLSACSGDSKIMEEIESAGIGNPNWEKFEEPTPDSRFPTGNYILLTHQYGTDGTDQFVLSFYNEGERKCSWEETTTMPTQFLEKSTLYVVEANCSGMGDLVVTWDLSQNIATLNGEVIPVWSNVGSQYFLLT